jgi:hypothetical protein
MILNKEYYRMLWEKVASIKTLNKLTTVSLTLTLKLILKHYNEGKSIHINFQNSQESIFEIAKHLFTELANDIYLNHYDLPGINDGDQVKKKSNGDYYIVRKLSNSTYRLIQKPRKAKKQQLSTIIPSITYDKLITYYVRVEFGVSDKTIKNYFGFFESLNSIKAEFPRTSFERKSVFVSKKTLWDSLTEKNKIPSTYMPNPREENGISGIKSIPALSDCMVYFTPKYDVCYQQILLKGKDIKTIILFDTEADKIEQILQDKARFGFNLIILSNSYSPIKNQGVPCWDWFREEIETVNAL